MSEIYNRIRGSIPAYSVGRENYFSEVFWFAMVAIADETKEANLITDITDELKGLTGMTTKGDAFYSQYALQHIIDKISNGLLQITFDEGVTDAARQLIASNVFDRFDEVKPLLLWLGDSTRAGEIEEKMSKGAVSSMRAGYYKKWFLCVEVVNEMITDHKKGRFSMVGALTGYLITAKGSPLPYPSSGIVPFFRRMQEKGVRYEL